MATPTCVLFDIGNVFVPWDPRTLYEGLIADKEELDWFMREVVTLSWHTEHDRGKPFAEGVRDLSAKFPEYGDLIQLFDTRWDDTIGEPIAGTVHILEELHERGVPAYALTNFSAEKFPQFKRQHAWTDFFNGIVVSGEEKLIKPDPRIYHVVLDRYNLDPENLIFVDDRADNVAAAEQLGMAGHIFTAPEVLRDELSAMGLL